MTRFIRKTAAEIHRLALDELRWARVDEIDVGVVRSVDDRLRVSPS
jgi:hypothetical protein